MFLHQRCPICDSTPFENYPKKEIWFYRLFPLKRQNQKYLSVNWVTTPKIYPSANFTPKIPQTNIQTSYRWYNSEVPTPFYHLYVAEDLLEHQDFTANTQFLISQYTPAFLLGHVAPDVQVISGQTRESTHFYSLPLQTDDEPPWKKIQSTHPGLAPDQISDPEHGVFIAGYLCHLQADLFWTEHIFEPYFGPLTTWKSFRERLYLHNVLRAYLDFRVLETLNREVRLGLGQGNPRTWLPFVSADHLKSWQGFLTDQLKPGASIRTVDVFAARQGISAEAYYQLISTEDEMQYQIFDFFPRQNLQIFWENLIEANLTLLNEYLMQIKGVVNAGT